VSEQTAAEQLVAACKRQWEAIETLAAMTPGRAPLPPRPVLPWEPWERSGKVPDVAIVLAVCRAQHAVLDFLFATLIERVPDFYPSKSGEPWDAMVAGFEAIRRAELGGASTPVPAFPDCRFPGHCECAVHGHPIAGNEHGNMKCLVPAVNASAAKLGWKMPYPTAQTLADKPADDA
jgi:hypothetical protein